MDLAQAFGRSIKAKRAEVGISQEELAYQAGLARSFLSKIENGKIGVTLTTIERIARILKCKPSSLMLRAEDILSSLD